MHEWGITPLKPKARQKTGIRILPRRKHTGSYKDDEVGILQGTGSRLLRESCETHSLLNMRVN